MTAVLPPPINFQGFTQNGSLNAFGFVATYAAGSTTPIATYMDATQATPNPNPVPLNAIGQAAIWLSPGTGYKFVETDQFGNQCGFADQINASGAGVTSNLVPAINNVFNIGSPTFQWANGYFGGSIYINGVSVFLGQTPAEASVGAIVVNPQYPPMCVDRYATNSIPLVTDMSAAFTKAVSVAQRNGGIVTYGATAPYLVTSPINCTFGSSANQKGIIIQGPDGSLDSGAIFGPGNMAIVAKHTGQSVFCCVGNDSIKFRDVAITCDPTTYPVTGILFARNQLGPASNSQVNRLDNVRIAGKFSDSCYYNYGSEDDVLSGCYFANFATTANTATRRYTANNISGLVSDFAVDNFGNPVSICVGSASCIDHNDFGCQDWNAGGTATSDCIVLEGADSFKKYGGWALSASNTANGRSLIYVDLTNAASNFCSINGLTGEQAAFMQAYGILFSNAPSGANQYIPINWSVNESKLVGVTAGLATAGATTTLDNFTLSGTAMPLSGISIPGTLRGSPAFNYGNEIAPVVIGNSTKNKLIGETANLSPTMIRSTDDWDDTGSINKTIATVGTSGGITSSAGALIARARLILTGPCLTFQVVLASSSGTLSIAGGSQISLTAPGGQNLALADSGVCTVVDQTAGTINGAGVTNTGASILITIPVVVSATPHNIIVSGTVFLA